MKRFDEWACPGCGCTVRVLGASGCWHECPARKYRVTAFKRVGAEVKAS